MSTPETIYLGLADVVGLYADVFGYSDDDAYSRLRDEEGLQGALGRPEAHAHYADADLAQQGAVLAHGIAQGQYFLEGNKRSALAALATFLQINGHDLIAPQAERAEWMLALSGGLTTDWLAERIRASIDPMLD